MGNIDDDREEAVFQKDGTSEKQIEQVSASWTPEEERKLVTKVDWALLPMMWVMYLLSYMDRTNIGNAKVSGMETDLDMDSNDYSIALVVFFVGYVVCQVPSNMILTVARPSLYLPAIMFTWGALTCVMAAIHEYKYLVVLRALIGCVEAGFAPGILLLLSCWYKKDEQAKRFGVYISAAVLSGAFGGLIAAGITGNLDGAHGISGWRWLFIVEGAATSGVALVSLFLLPNFPATSRMLTPKERDIAIARLAEDNVTAMTEDSDKLSPWKSLALSLKDWRTWAFTVGYMVIVGSSTITYFFPSLVEGLFGKASTMQVNLLTVPIYAAAFVFTLVTVYFCDRIKTFKRGVVIAGWMAFSMITSIVVCAVFNYGARYAMLMLLASGLWATNAVSLAFASSTFADLHPQVRSISLAFVNAMGNLAQIYGSYLFPDEDSPKYLMGFGVITGMLAVGTVTFAALHIHMIRVNRPRVSQA